MSAEGAKELIGLHWTPEDPAGKEQCVALLPRAIHHLAGQDGRVYVRAFEPFVPVSLVVDDPTVGVLLPQGCSSVDAQAIEAKGVQFQTGRKAEALQDVLLGLSG